MRVIVLQLWIAQDVHLLTFDYFNINLHFGVCECELGGHLFIERKYENAGWLIKKMPIKK